MGWCPKCDNEYREGIVKCADCGSNLVEEINEHNKMIPVLGGPKEKLDELMKFFDYSKIKDVDLFFDEKESMHVIRAWGNERNKAEVAVQIFLSKMREEAKKEEKEFLRENGVEDSETIKIEVDNIATQDIVYGEGEYAEGEGVCEKECPKCGKTERNHVYESTAARVENHKSSAWALSIVGILGLLFLVLSYFEIIPVKLSGSGLVYIVLAIIFAVFVVMSFVSLSSAKKLQGEVSEEEERIKALKEFCLNKISGDEIDKEVRGKNDSEETLYFKRYEKVKALLFEQFPDAEEQFLDHYLDEGLYDEIFGDEE